MPGCKYASKTQGELNKHISKRKHRATEARDAIETAPAASPGSHKTVRIDGGDGKVTGSSQTQLLDRLVQQVTKAIRSFQPQGGKVAEIESARCLLADAHAAKQLLAKLLTGVELAQESLLFGPSMRPMVEELLAKHSHLQGLGDNLVRCALSQCGSALDGETLRSAIEGGLGFMATVVQSAVIDNASSRLAAKFAELSTVNGRALVEKVLKELIDKLTHSYRALVGDKEVDEFLENEKKRSSTPDAVKSRIRQSSDLNVVVTPAWPHATGSARTEGYCKLDSNKKAKRNANFARSVTEDTARALETA